MNKKEFLDILEKKLSILDESERTDILDEYKDTITEKVKHGQTEEEAVADFGDVDELVKEILSAYKINPDFENKDENTFNKLLNDGEDLIKKGADKLAKTSRELASDFKMTNKDINLSLVFEIVIKIIVILFLVGLLRIPFMFIYDVGRDMLESIFSPFGSLFSFLFRILLLIIYLILCVLIGISLFKNYFKHDMEEDIKKEDKIKEEEIKEVKEERNNEFKEQSKSNHSALGEAIILIIKVWVIIFVMIPAVFIDLGILFGLCLAVVYLIKGINLFGLVILLSGCLIMCSWFILLIYRVLFKSKKINLIPLIISTILMMIGGLLFTDMIINVDYYNGIPKDVKISSKIYEYKLDQKVSVSNYAGNIDEKIDNKMSDGEIKIKVNYYKSVTKVLMSDYNNDDYMKIDISNDYQGVNSTKFLYNNFIDNLKDNKVYNYDGIYNFDVTIYGNEKTLEMVEEVI